MFFLDASLCRLPDACTTTAVPQAANDLARSEASLRPLHLGHTVLPRPTSALSVRDMKALTDRSAPCNHLHRPCPSGGRRPLLDERGLADVPAPRRGQPQDSATAAGGSER